MKIDLNQIKIEHLPQSETMEGFSKRSILTNLIPRAIQNVVFRSTHDPMNNPTPLRDRHTISIEQIMMLLESTHDFTPNLRSSDTTCYPLRRNTDKQVQYWSPKISALNAESTLNNMTRAEIQKRKRETNDLTRFNNLLTSSGQKREDLIQTTEL